MLNGERLDLEPHHPGGGILRTQKRPPANINMGLTVTNALVVIDIHRCQPLTFQSRSWPYLRKTANEQRCDGGHERNTQVPAANMSTAGRYGSRSVGKTHISQDHGVVVHHHVHVVVHVVLAVRTRTRLAHGEAL